MDANSDGADSSDFLALLQQLESGGRNIPNTTQGTSSGPAQGFEQITTGTWRDFAPASGIDLHRYPTPMSAPADVQLQVARNIPMRRWDPKTLRGLIAGGYTVDPNRTLGQNIALNGGASSLNAAPEEDILGEALGGIPAVPGRIDPSVDLPGEDPLAAAATRTLAGTPSQDVLGEALAGAPPVAQSSAPVQNTPPINPGAPSWAGTGASLDALNAVPIVGPALLKGQAGANALLSYIPGVRADTGSLADRFGAEQAGQAAEMQTYNAANPRESVAARLAGGALGSAGMVAAAPAAFGISGAGLATNMLAGAGTNALISAVDTVVRGGSLSDAGKSAAIGGALGAAAPVVGAGMNALGRGLTGGVIPADDAQLAQLATQKYGIPLTAPQVTANPGLKIAGSTLNRLPFSGAENFQAGQQGAFNRAVASTIGESADKITPQIMNAARQRIGAMYDQAAQNTVIGVDAQFQQDLHGVLNSATQVLPKAEAEPLLRQAQNMIEKIDRTTKTIPGDVYQALTNTGSPLDRLINSEDSNLSFYANGLKKALDGALERSASPADQEMLRTADRQWAAMRTIQPIVAKSPTGDVSPALLAGRVNAQTGNGMAFGYGGDLGELARIGQKFLKEPGSSNTAERLATMAGTIGGVPNALLAAAHGDLMGAAGTALGVPLASLMVGRGVGGVLRSQTLANALINRSLPGAAGPTIPSWLAATALGASTGRNALLGQ